MKGFTLVEILISLAILAVVLTVALHAILSFRAVSDLNATGEQVASFLSEARNKTLASKSDTQYGIRFNLDRCVFFSGAVFASSTPGNKEYVFPRDVEISSIALAGGSKDTVFDRLTGETAGSGAITVRIKADTSRTRTVSISSTGLVTIQ